MNNFKILIHKKKSISTNWGGDIITKRGSIYKRRGSFINSIYCVDKSVKIDLNFDDSLLSKMKKKSISPQPQNSSGNSSNVKEVTDSTTKTTTTSNNKAYKEKQNFWQKEIDTKEPSNELISQGLEYCYQKQFDQAIYTFNKLIESNPNCSEAYNYKGYIFKIINSFILFIIILKLKLESFTLI
jgi:tetratricopeptide (TPR) repeat protein